MHCTEVDMQCSSSPTPPSSAGSRRTRWSAPVSHVTTVLLTHIGSIIPAIVSHTFCNYMGIDLPTAAAQRHPSKKLCGSRCVDCTNPAAIYSAYLAGVAAFAYGMTKF